MSNEESTIAFTTDILKSVSEKNNIPLEVVKYSYDIMLRNLENLIKDTDATSISVPEIGTLYANYKMLKVLKQVKKRKNEDVSIVESKLDKIDNLIEKNKHNENYRTNRHLQKKFIRNYFFSKGLSVEDIENKQNETRE